MSWFAKLTGFVVVLFGALARNSLAGDDDTDGSRSTTLEVILPTFMNGQLFHKDAMFGMPLRGSPDIIGSVEYVTKGNADGCSDQYEVPKLDEKGANRIFLVDRGQCTFAQKARIAQSKGANGLIVVNNKCLERNMAKWGDKGNTYCTDGVEQILPVMAYDNNGRDITIPAFLITKYDGELMKDCLLGRSDVKSPSDTCSKKVIVRMMVDIPQIDQVSWELWSSADDPPADMHTLAAVNAAMKEEISDVKYDFTPNYLMFDGHDFACECKNQCQSKPCAEMCVYAQESDADDYQVFCAVPAARGSRSSNGAEVVQENIRQKCIWKSHDNKEVWWNFMREFEVLNCDKPGDDSLQECSKKASDQTSGFKDKDVEDCISKELKKLSESKSMSQRMKREEIFTTQFSANGIRYDFGFTPVFLAQILCDVFTEENKPKACRCVPINDDMEALRDCVEAKCFDDSSRQFYCPQSDSCVSSSKNCPPASSGGGASALQFVFGILLVCSIVGAGFYVYQRRARRQMQEQVRDILSEYMPLEELNTFEPSSSSNGGFMRARNEEDTVGVI